MSGRKTVRAPSSARTNAHPRLPAGIVVVLLRSDNARRRIGAALGQTATVIQCSTIREARSALGQQPVSAILTEAVDCCGVPTSALIQDIRRLFPRTVALGCIARSPTLSPESLALVRAGVHDVLLTDDLDMGFVVRQVIRAARLRCMVDALWPVLEPTLDDVLAPFLRFSLEHAYAPLDVRQVAAALGAHRKTLWERCRCRGVPPPHQLLSWCRVLAAAFTLDEHGRTVDSVADELDFPSPSALRNLIQRYLQLTPSALRARGGSSYAVGCLSARLRSSGPLRRALLPGKRGRVG